MPVEVEIELSLGGRVAVEYRHLRRGWVGGNGLVGATPIGHPTAFQRLQQGQEAAASVRPRKPLTHGAGRLPKRERSLTKTFDPDVWFLTWGKITNFYDNVDSGGLQLNSA